MFAGKDRSLLYGEHLKGVPLGQDLILLENNKSSLAWTNALAYSAPSSVKNKISGLYYKHITIVNNNSSVVNK
jgi:hypothetical protein